MKYIKFIVLFAFAFTQTHAQHISDSVVVLSDLKYHSDFEKKALQNFVKHQKDTFNLMMAIDENMTEDQSIIQYNKYCEIFRELSLKKIESKSLNAKIKMSYNAVHDKFLKRYSDNEFFPTTLETGLYNCVSATILYAMIFDHLKIPYKIMASTNHVYLVANPGSKSVVIETTNPGFENAVFTGELKSQYVNNLRESKLISADDYKNKSTEEIFQEHFKEVKDATLYNLPGFQYHNKALKLAQNNNIENAYKLAQKAYFFAPDIQCKALLNNTLIYLLDKCSFNKVNDIDYLVQYSRFENTDIDVIVGLFNNALLKQLQFNNKEAFCDSLYQRFISQYQKKEIVDEISFTFNLQMAYRFQFNDKAISYAGNALKIKPNHVDANMIFKNQLNAKLRDIDNPVSLLDTINKLKVKYVFDQSEVILNEYALASYLRSAKDAFTKNKLQQGEKFIQLFEGKCQTPVKSELVKYEIEKAYYAYSSYYYRKKNFAMQKTIINKVLKYVPDSDLTKGAVFQLIKL